MFCKRSKYLVLGPIDPIELPGTGICTVFLKAKSGLDINNKNLTINVSSFKDLIFLKSEIRSV